MIDCENRRGYGRHLPLRDCPRGMTNVVSARGFEAGKEVSGHGAINTNEEARQKRQQFRQLLVRKQTESLPVMAARVSA